MAKEVYNGVDVATLHDAGSILIWYSLVSICLLLPDGWVSDDAHLCLHMSCQSSEGHGF